MMTTIRQAARKSYGRRLLTNMREHWQLYIMIVPPLMFFILFQYVPMYGLQLAFKEFNAMEGIWGSPWVGWDNFRRFFNAYNCWTLIRNTLGISFYQILVGFPIPIIFALLVNEINNAKYKKTIQMVSYAPHFISLVVIVSIMTVFFDQSKGFINVVLMKLFGMERGIPFLSSNEWFRTMYVFSGVWQNAGYSAIVYIAALSGVDMQVQEAAIVDGASKLKRIWHVQLPAIMPTVMILLIMECGNVMKVGFEKVLLMQNALNMGTSDIISTYVYRVGITNADFSFGTTVDLFNSVVSCVVLVTVNQLSKWITQNSLW